MTRDLLDALSRAEKEGHVALTRHLCEQLLADEPSHGYTLIRYADSLIDLSLYENAAVVLDHAERVIPREQQQLVLAQRGHLCSSMGDHAEADRFFIAAHKHDPDDATYLIYAASAAFARGDITRAESLARNAVECSDGCIDEAYFNLGSYLLAQKKYDEARRCYVRALEIDPEYRIAKTRLEDLDCLLKFQGKHASTSNSGYFKMDPEIGISGFVSPPDAPVHQMSSEEILHLEQDSLTSEP